MRLSATRQASIAQSRGFGNLLWDLAGMPPLLDLRLAENKSLVNVVSGVNLATATRGSSGTFVGSDRLIQSAGVDVPRFTHDPVTGESLGLLVEEQRINSIRNNTMVGAVAGTPGTLPTNWITTGTAFLGITNSIQNIGTSDGIAYIDLKFQGTATATAVGVFQFEATAHISASPGQAWTSSAYASLVGGSFANVDAIGLTLRENDSGGNFLRQTIQSISSAASSFARFTSSATLGASTAFVTAGARLSIVSGAVVDFTLRIGLPQLEQGSGATSVIPTTNATVTRSADVIDLINQAIANNIRTLYLEFRSPAVGTRGVVSLNDNTANERASVITSGTDPRLVVVDGGVEQANINGGTVVANARTRVAVRITTNSFAISINGGPVITDSSGSLPSVDRIMLGRTQAGEHLNAPLARVIGWPNLVPDSLLQALSQ